jgi:dihydrofolate synthase/folylpolyglutamate synthase
MNYQETLSYLYSRTPVFQHTGSTAYKPGLDNMLALDARLQHPHRAYHTIHVGGTNGKGSVSHLLAAVLQGAGYRVGLYTSPHLLDFRERIRVDGKMIPTDNVVNYVARHRSFIETVQPSFFEITTGMAFEYFAHSAVDVAVIEVGLGGRLDSTNIITPLLSVITNISKDHVDLLGDTLEKIAAEKAGIIKENIPVVIGEAPDSKVRALFVQKAAEANARILFAEEKAPIVNARCLPDGKWLFQTAKYPHLTGELSGPAQRKNADTVLCALEELDRWFFIPSRAVYQGFANVVACTGLQGRWQTIAHSPRIVLDTGHNEAGIAQIACRLKQEKYHRLHIVIGIVQDKDLPAILRHLPCEAHYYFTKAQIPRALPETELFAKASAAGLPGKSYPALAEAIAAARCAASPNDMIFVGGSNFIVAEALKIFAESPR